MAAKTQSKAAQPKAVQIKPAQPKPTFVKLAQLVTIATV